MSKRRIFLVDDEPAVLKSLARALCSRLYDVRTFNDADECLKQLRHSDCDLLITDVIMPGMDGIALLHQAKKISAFLPVLIITGYADIPLAVSAIKAGAVDFIEKPFDKKDLIKRVEDALTNHDQLDLTLGEGLTKVQKRVLKLILSAKSNKEIANILGRSVRTIEVHRGKIMRKLGVDNIVDLVMKASGKDLDQLSEEGE